MILLPSCPICKKALPVDDDERRRFFPFCSQRCRQVDFFRWVDGRYAIVEPLSADQLADRQADVLGPTDVDEAE